MSLAKFLQTIERSAIGRFFDSKRRLIEQLNPDRIYIENVRHIYGIPYFAAKLFCDMAVIEGIFEKKVGIECPNDECGRIILSANKLDDVPETVSCKNCEILEKDKFTFTRSELDFITYYRLIH